LKHSTINIKVNAAVDKKIAPLVLALNKFDGIFTIDSCEGSQTQPAYVYFKYGSSPKDLAVFCSILVTSPKNIRKLAKAVDSVANNLRKTLFFYDK